MTRMEFENLLRSVTARAIEFAQGFVSNPLPKDSQLRVVLNQSHDAHLAEDEVIFPEDRGVVHSGLGIDEAVAVLYREGRCPVWIDVQAVGVEGPTTIVELDCAGRYTANEALMYYEQYKRGPFQVLGPDLPPKHSGKRGQPLFGLPTRTRDRTRKGDMRYIELRANKWKTRTDFANTLKAAIGAPDSHGSDVRDFIDSMVWHDEVNELKSPYTIKIVGVAEVGEQLRWEIGAMASVINGEAKFDRGTNLEVSIVVD